MTTATAVGIATGVGSMVAKAGHDYVLPHIPQANKWKTIESASLNAGMASTSGWGYVVLMDSDVANANAVPIIGYDILVYHKAKDVAKTLYNDAKDLMHQPFQLLSSPLTMAAVGISGIAVIYGLTKF